MGKQGAHRATVRSLRYRICRWESGQVRGQAGPQISGHAGWAGKTGVSVTRGGGSQSQSEGQPGAGEGQQQGRGGIFEQPGQQWGLGQGLLGPGVGDTLPWGVCSPTPSNRRQLRAGGRGAAVSGAGGVLTC